MRFDESILSVFLYLKAIFALYVTLSFPINSKIEYPSLVPLLRYCRSSESRISSWSVDDFCGDDCNLGVVPNRDNAMQSKMVDFPVPVVPHIKKSDASDSGSELKSIVASSIDAML